jgi:hypothetical protein
VSSFHVLTDGRLFPRWIVLVLVGLAAESAAAAPRLVCYPLVAGDTITSVSIRLTGDPHSWQGSRLQILDPAAARLIPKTEYRFLRPEWQACIGEPPGVHPVIGGLEMLVLLCSAAAAALLVFQWSVERRKTVTSALETFGAAFIREFERPLMDERSPQPVLRAELSVSPSQRSLEVRLAPADGKRYPNLADHRTNVQYDVERVVGVLNDRRFVCGPLSARGSWVAIPFRLKSNVRKEGEP